MAAEKQDYTVTAKAGRYVAGQKVAAGDTLSLTDSQAEYELMLGTIVLKGTERPKAEPEPSAAPEGPAPLAVAPAPAASA